MLLKVLYFSLKIQKLKIYLLLNKIFLTEFSQKKKQYLVYSLYFILITKYTDSRRKRIQCEQIK